MNTFSPVRNVKKTTVAKDVIDLLFIGGLLFLSFVAVSNLDSLIVLAEHFHGL